MLWRPQTTTPSLPAAGGNGDAVAVADNNTVTTVGSMAAAGVVFLPGMMTGQVLAGVAPEQAVKYQILVLFLIAGATGLGVLTAVMASVWRLTDNCHRLRLDRLS